MQRRALLVNETRQRITEAAVRLHTSIGPAHTSIASVAEAAGVTRLTVYRHFPDMAALFSACSAHWFGLHPFPDPAGWTAIVDDEARIRTGIGAIYGWYETAGTELYPIHRDLASVPEASRTAILAQRAELADRLVGAADRLRPAAHRRRRAVAGHLVSVVTWHSLTADQGLTLEEAADLAATFILDATHEPRHAAGAPRAEASGAAAARRSTGRARPRQPPHRSR
jgi:AcrR family transcriptional regulator